MRTRYHLSSLQHFSREHLGVFCAFFLAGKSLLHFLRFLLSFFLTFALAHFALPPDARILRFHEEVAQCS